MKATRKNLSVKVDLKNTIVENHQEFVRIKRNVIKRISRKGIMKGEIIGCIKEQQNKVNIFQHYLKSFIGNNISTKLNAPFQKNTAKNGNENDMYQGFNGFTVPNPETRPPELRVSNQENEEKISDLYMPLQF